MDPVTRIIIVAAFGLIILLIGILVILLAFIIKRNFGNEAGDLAHIIGGTICHLGFLVLCLCLAWYLFIFETESKGFYVIKVVGGGLVFTFAIGGVLIQGLIRECSRKIRHKSNRGCK